MAGASAGGWAAAWPGAGMGTGGGDASGDSSGGGGGGGSRSAASYKVCGQGEGGQAMSHAASRWTACRTCYMAHHSTTEAASDSTEDG